MYEALFDLKRRPFAATPDPNCWYHCDRYQAVLDELLVCAEQGQGVGIVVASPGVGKTLLCERLVRDIGEPFTSVLLRHATFQSRRAFLQTLLAELAQPFDLATDQELRLSLMPVLRGLGQQGRALLLVVDEAHQLSESILEELRILSDLAVEGRPLVRLILCGQLSLEEKLAHPQLQALNQRVRAHISVPPLTLAESADYIDYRITWAGGRTDEIFEPAALDAICRAADGVPRCLNQLCDHVLLLAYVGEQRPVPVDLVHDALDDLQHLPLSWNMLGHRSGSDLELPTFESPSTTTPSAASISFESPSSGATSAFELIGDRAESDESAPTIRADAPHGLGDPMQPISSTPAESYDTESEDLEAGFIEEAVDNPTEWPTPQQASATGMLGDSEPGSIDAAGQPLDSDGWREELVLDRYTALDAGLEPPADETAADEPPAGETAAGETTADEAAIDHTSAGETPASPTAAEEKLFEDAAADLLRTTSSIDERLQIVQQVLDYVRDGDLSSGELPAWAADAESASEHLQDDHFQDQHCQDDAADETLPNTPQQATGGPVSSVETSELIAPAAFDEPLFVSPAAFAEQTPPGMQDDSAQVESRRTEERAPAASEFDHADFGHTSDTARRASLSGSHQPEATVLEIGADAPAAEVGERPRSATQDRPIRNLFTLLRKKQQGRL